MADLHKDIKIAENKDPLVDLAGYAVLTDPVYFRLGLSDVPHTFTRRAIADKLIQLQNGPLAGYQFKVWDSWRSRTTQRTIYQRYLSELKALHPDWDEEKARRETAVYVAAPDHPSRIPPHTTGGAIDLTLVDRTAGQELSMGTVFDHFGPEAAPDYFEHAVNNICVRDNRRLLQSAMRSAGFAQDPDEWWHFDYGNQKWAEAVGMKEAFYGEITAVKDC